MVDFISFFVVVAVKMIDPIALLMALVIGYFAARKEDQARGVVIAIGAVAMVAALTAFVVLMDRATGLSHSNALTGFGLLTGVVAAALQIGLIAWGVTSWRKRRDRLVAEKIEPRA